MGANRDWALAPFLLVVRPDGDSRVVRASGPPSVVPWRRRNAGPLLTLIGCWTFFAFFALWQTTTWDASHTADACYSTAPPRFLARRMRRYRRSRPTRPRQFDAEVPCLRVDFPDGARALCRDHDVARWLLVALVASGVLVVSYGLRCRFRTNSCYLGGYLRKQFEINPAITA